MIYFHPVIHVEDFNHSVEQGAKAYDAGANGVWLIQHNGISELALKTAVEIKNKYPDLYVGVNLLGETPLLAGEQAVQAGLDGVWLDYAGVSSRGITSQGWSLFEFLQAAPLDVFAGVAFKYQETESDPVEAVRQVNELGWIPCTSGFATGTAADPSKIKLMGSNSDRGLAIASGIDIDNFESYLPWVTHFFVASSISENFTTLDFEKMYRLKMAIEKASTAVQEYS